MGRLRRWMLVAPDEEVASLGVTLAVLALLAYGYLSLEAFRFMDDDVPGWRPLVAGVPLVFAAIGAQVGRRRGRRTGRQRGFALVTAAIWLFASTAVILAAATALLVIALSTWDPV